MVIKNLTKKVIVSTVMAGSLFVLPQFSQHHAAHAATATISTTHQVLHYGSRGSSVKSVQTRLTQLGFFKYKVDGIYGNLTRNAVKNYQKANNLSVDGIAGPNTLGKLFGTSSKSASSKTSTKIKTASTSHSTTSLQSKLKSLGYYHDSVDGIFGAHSRNAVMDFQRANGLVVDGIPGKNTWAKLDSNPVAASASTTTMSTSPKTVNVSSSASNTSSLVSNIISDAKALEGIRYKYGGTTTSGFDCSGFTQYVFRENGISLPRTAAQQYSQGSATALVPGALVFFSSNGSSITHVGIYIGNNEFIEASSSHGITIASMSSSYWKPKYVGAKTYINFQS